MMKSIPLSILWMLPVSAAPLPVGEIISESDQVQSWPLTGAGAHAIAAGASAMWNLNIPALSEKEQGVGGSWRGIVSLDLFGTSNGQNATVMLEAIDAVSKDPIASEIGQVAGPAPRSPWVVISSSGHRGAEATKAFDGDSQSDWHSDYSGGKNPPPHWLGLEFGMPTRMTGVNYLPRQTGFTNGVARNYRVDIRRPGGDWETMVAGETDGNVRDDRAMLEVSFPEPVEADAFRFVIESDWSGGGFGTAAEIQIPGVQLEPVANVTAISRSWLEIPPDRMAALENKSFRLQVRNTSEHAVVIGSPDFARVHDQPSGKLFGRSNGGLGPDKLGAGLLGFDALTEHRQKVLSVMGVRADSPAAGQGLQQGDVILAVRGRPLPVNDVAPGWTWFHDSHEAVIGRETEAALHAGETTLPITLLRDGKQKSLTIPLDRKAAFTTMNPANDSEASRMLEDMIAFLLRTQRDDGSWSRCMIRTCLSGLALMATGEKAHVEQVQKAIQWAKDRYKKPEDYGNLGFWAGSFAGIFYSEWHLATGDESVIPNLTALRDWAIGGQHVSIWEVPALGHGTSGLPYGNKALVAPACHLLVFESLAMRCGMKSGIWELLMPYMEMSWSDPSQGGNGTLGYNRSMKDLEEFWSRSGLFAMAAHLRGERNDMRDSMLHVMIERHPWLRNSHAYGEPGGALGLLALNLISPSGYATLMQEYAWWFSLAWETGYGLRFTTPHMGAPYMGEDDLINAAYALVLQSPKRNLHITGKPKPPSRP